MRTKQSITMSRSSLWGRRNPSPCPGLQMYLEEWKIPLALYRQPIQEHWFSRTGVYERWVRGFTTQKLRSTPCIWLVSEPDPRLLRVTCSTSLAVLFTWRRAWKQGWVYITQLVVIGTHAWILQFETKRGHSCSMEMLANHSLLKMSNLA